MGIGTIGPIPPQEGVPGGAGHHAREKSDQGTHTGHPPHRPPDPEHSDAAQSDTTQSESEQSEAEKSLDSPEVAAVEKHILDRVV
jgi:hypothetical protein